MNKIKGIKTAVGIINNNRNLNHNIITDGVTVWVDAFADTNSWHDYHYKTIKCIGKWRAYPFCNDNIKMADIQEMIERSRI